MLHRRWMFRLGLPILLVVGFCGFTAGASLEQSIRSLLNHQNNRRSTYSIQIVDPENGRTIFGHNASKPLVPASNMKIVTTAAAVELLGPGFVYETTISLWNNNLLVQGAGDPLTGDPKVAAEKGRTIFHVFDHVLAALRDKQMKVIPGKLLIDDTIFDDLRFHPSWPTAQANNWYCAQVSGLNFNNNCVDILFSPGERAGAVADFELMPDTSYIRIENKCLTSRTKTAVGAARKIGTNEITLRGTCHRALTKPIYVTVDMPSAYFGYVMAEYLLKNSVRIDGQLSVLMNSLGHELPEGAEVLAVHKTPLQKVLEVCNQRSLNMAAECLMKTLGAYFGKDVQDGRIDTEYEPGMASAVKGSWETGRQVMVAFLKRTGADRNEFAVDDGCGLSYNNKLSAATVCKVLQHMYRSEHFGLYRESMATPEDGTLARKGRLGDVDNLWGKTGYVAVANSLSGYCETASGRTLVFSILSNRPPAPNSTLDRIVEMIVEKR